MASTYTVNLGIEKIGTGEQSGTWGATTNTNFDLIDQAVNGAVTVTLASAGTSGVPNTLAITNGAASDGRNKFIDFNDGGDLGATAYVQLTPNDAEKIVHVRNSLSGGRSVIVFQGTYNASNDFEVPNGKDVVLKFDGAGASATVTDVFTDLQATAITTPDLTATTADINGGTIDGVTIGGSSAGAGTFTNLTATGTTTLAGASTSADITFGDNDKAIFGAGSDLQIYHDGSNSYITDSGTGNLRISGTLLQLNDASFNKYLLGSGDSVTLYNADSAKLATTSTGIDVTGTVTADGADLDGAVVINKSGADADFRVESDSNTHALFVNAGDSRVGINESSPNAMLHVKTSGTDEMLRLEMVDDSATSGPDIVMQRVSASPATNDSVGRIRAIGENSSGSGVTYGRMEFFIDDPTAGSESGLFSISTELAGANIQRLAFKPDEVVFNEPSADSDFRVESDSNTHALFVDAGNDRVGINNSSPSGLFELQETSGTTFDATDTGGQVANGATLSVQNLSDATNSFSQILLRTRNTSKSVSRIASLVNGTGTELVFVNEDQGSNPAERMRIRKQGQVIIPGGVTLGTSANVYADANTLDDYEEGTFTPALEGMTGGSVTYTSQFGRYTKIGRQVNVFFFIRVNTNTNTAGNTGVNVPFAPDVGGSNYIYVGALGRNSSSNSSISHVSFFSGAAKALFYTPGAGTLSGGNIPNGTVLSASITYFV